uniref:Alpha-tubulin N-acetyltransferase n=1 Tax=Alexandrium catenella TaxID=2925 RepID=A0A7S1WTK7_ALECA|mmetsp:Transcript_89137/g.236866  ORF Transcript_89137/g.236866 Transcript_89137/m.236866 type:complete len:265 (+) Transcript_89137:75-869(+)
MEFSVNLAELVGAPTDHDGPCVGYVDERALRGSGGAALSTVLEELGRRSAAAQGLRKPVTYGSAAGLGDQRVFLLVDGRKALGLLKVGGKRLFVTGPPVLQRSFADVQGAFREIEPLCVLDFYIHERYQRSGFGRQLFDAMLDRERAVPSQLGYDRPSPKLLGFLEKHFRLNKFQPQNNNFVVFDAYFGGRSEEPAGRHRSSHLASRGATDERDEWAAAATAAKPRSGVGSALAAGRSAGDTGRAPDLFGDAWGHRRAAPTTIF